MSKPLSKPIGGLTVGGRPKPQAGAALKTQGAAPIASALKTVSNVAPIRKAVQPSPLPVLRTPQFASTVPAAPAGEKACSQNVRAREPTIAFGSPIGETGKIVPPAPVAISKRIIPTEVPVVATLGPQHHTPLPQPQPFPNPVPKATLLVLDGTKLEAPFSTDLFKEFPERGVYACIRCQQPIAAANTKVPCDFGYSGFRQFNASSCNVVVHLKEDGEPFVMVRCGTCNGLMGELVQRAVGCHGEVEVLKANSLCLHFVDSSSTPSLAHNYVPERPSSGSSGRRGLSGERDDDDEDLEMRLEELDFDDMDVIGTDDGAFKAVNKRREKYQLWKRSGPSTMGPPPPAVSQANAPITAEQRHHAVMDTLNAYSSSSEDQETSGDEDEDSES